MRVLKWVVDRCRGRAGAVESVLGWMPRARDLEWTGLDSDVRSRYGELMSIDRELWMKELARHEELFAKLGDKLSGGSCAQAQFAVGKPIALGRAVDCA
jgi:phosphoenolpyruvate carboxykinase (GTP)